MCNWAHPVLLCESPHQCNRHEALWKLGLCVLALPEKLGVATRHSSSRRLQSVIRVTPGAPLFLRVTQLPCRSTACVGRKGIQCYPAKAGPALVIFKAMAGVRFKVQLRRHYLGDWMRDMCSVCCPSAIVASSHGNDSHHLGQFFFSANLLWKK